MSQPNSPLFSHYYYFTQIPSEISRPEPVEPPSSVANDGWSASIGFLVLLSSLVLLLLSLRQSKPSLAPPTRGQTGKPLSSLLNPDLPCRHCQYFNANRFLPCAVNPVQVLTPEASDCTDFQAANSQAASRTP
ncbi:hypothetical protein [Leptolyngbya iicbica]|uniref:Uncharacterized protein n=2 Tax=Cyanophyceae TaxID=3028117 RepID=A0A4Q7E833_9CYAN|nr:hypothetical protein [Leptolyngbya sp. LK]RZM78688.1 hypothetical protein DYY88_07745 [Leptolyngbya sp. LK]